MNGSLGKAATLGFALLFVSLLGGAGFIYRGTRRLIDNDQSVAHTREIRAGFADVLAGVTDAEDGQRGYLLTGEDAYLEPYRHARALIDRHLEHLRGLLADDPDLRPRLAELEQYVRRRLAQLQRHLDLRDEGRPDAVRQAVLTDEGRREMTALRALVGVVEQEEGRRLADSVAAAQRSAAEAIATGLLTTGIALILAAAVFYLIRHNDRDRQRAEQALREADRRKDEFLAMLAHELRNPLAPLRHAAAALRLRGGEDPQTVWSRDVIERQVEYLARLVDDLLDVSRIARGKLQLLKGPAELSAVVERAVEASRPLLDARQQRLDVKRPAEGVWVEGDPTRLAQVLVNLLNNAAKYTPAGGQVEVALEEADHEAVLRVRDTGVGIPAEMLPKVFDLFMQVERTLDRAEGGLGIGLTLVRRLVGLHGGTVEAHSDGPGRGSEFVVRLPLLAGVRGQGSGAREETAVPSSLAPDPWPLTPDALRVLVVDDNADAADSLGVLLRLLGYDVTIATDGPAALAEAEVFRPDVILLDIGLPGMNGYEVARRLKEAPWFGRTVLVAMTGYSSAGDRRRSEETGFVQHLVKPVDVPTLQGLLASLAKAHRK